MHRMPSLLLALGLVSAACGPSRHGSGAVNYGLRTQVDPATGARSSSQRIVANSRADCGYPGLWLSSVTLLHSTLKDNASVFSVEATYVGPRRIFIENQAAQLLADTTHLSLIEQGRPSEGTGTGWVSEAGSYRLPAGQLAILRNAGAVKARLQGRDGACTVQLAPSELVRLRSFATHELQQRNGVFY
jgi:hypothetical protein